MFGFLDFFLNFLLKLFSEMGGRREREREEMNVF